MRARVAYFERTAIVGWTALALVVATASLGSVSARRVDVGGHDLRLVQKGRGQPTVVFDAGLGDSHEVWEWVWPKVARFTRVILYDRAGLGRSDTGPGPRTSEQIVKELHELLRQAKGGPPYVLVGHSLGGLNLRLFATRYPQEVAGLILVEATPVGFPAITDSFAESRTRMGTLLSLASPGVRGELDSVRESAEQVRAAGPLPDIPVVVLSSTRPEESPSFREIWLSMQKEMSARVGAEEHVITDRSGHYIQYDAPELVIDAIRRTVEHARHPALRASPRSAPGRS